jgi:hypothetical protein
MDRPPRHGIPTDEKPTDEAPTEETPTQETPTDETMATCLKARIPGGR